MTTLDSSHQSCQALQAEPGRFHFAAHGHLGDLDRERQLEEPGQGIASGEMAVGVRAPGR